MHSVNKAITAVGSLGGHPVTPEPGDMWDRASTPKQVRDISTRANRYTKCKTLEHTHSHTHFHSQIHTQRLMGIRHKYTGTSTQHKPILSDNHSPDGSALGPGHKPAQNNPVKRVSIPLVLLARNAQVCTHARCVGSTLCSGPIRVQGSVAFTRAFRLGSCDPVSHCIRLALRPCTSEIGAASPVDLKTQLVTHPV